MRITTHVVMSLSIVLILVMFSAAIRPSVVAVEAEGPEVVAAETASLAPLIPTPQAAPFIWVETRETGNYQGYRLVEGGIHKDGTMMYICRVGGTTPGKLYKNQCHYPMAGGETVVGKYQVLMTNSSYRWLKWRDVTPAQIEKEAVRGGVDEGGSWRRLYICRREMVDGIHPGKYLFGNNLCYVAWGNKETHTNRDFEILFP